MIEYLSGILFSQLQCILSLILREDCNCEQENLEVLLIIFKGYKQLQIDCLISRGFENLGLIY